MFNVANSAHFFKRAKNAPAIDPLINHQLTWWYPCVLLAAGLVFGIIGLIVFNRRDLPTV